MNYLEETCSSAADLEPCKNEPEHHLILYPGLLEAAFSASVLDTCLNFTTVPPLILQLYAGSIAAGTCDFVKAEAL